MQKNLISLGVLGVGAYVVYSFWFAGTAFSANQVYTAYAAIVYGLVMLVKDNLDLMKNTLKLPKLPNMPNFSFANDVQKDRNAIDHLMNRAKELQDQEVTNALVLLSDKFFKVHHGIK